MNELSILFVLGGLPKVNTRAQQPVGCLFLINWYRGPDLNRYVRNGHQILSLACLPIPPPRHKLLRNVYQFRHSPTKTNYFKRYSKHKGYRPFKVNGFNCTIR